MHTHAPLLSDFLPLQVKPPLQHLVINPLPFPQLLAFTLQQDVPPLKPLSACAHPPLLSVLIQGQGEPPLLPSNVRAYVPLLSTSLLLKGVPFHQPSSKPTPLPNLSALSLQRDVPTLITVSHTDRKSVVRL